MNEITQSQQSSQTESREVSNKSTDIDSAKSL